MDLTVGLILKITTYTYEHVESMAKGVDCTWALGLPQVSGSGDLGKTKDEALRHQGKKYGTKASRH